MAQDCELRSLGRSPYKTGPVALGTVTFGREADEESSRQILDYAFEQGLRFIDTAGSYTSEPIIGRWMRDRGVRQQVILCTKVNTGGTAESIEKALATSLEKLLTDYVDVYKMHVPDVKTPIDQTLGVLDEKVRQGQVRVIGASNYTAVQLAEALECSKTNGFARFDVIQPRYSLVSPEPIDEVFAICRQQQIGVTPYSPLASGFLTGKYTSMESKAPKGSRFDVKPAAKDVYFNDRNFKMLERLRQGAEDRGVPMAELALAWVMSHPDVTSTLVGSRHVEHIDQAIRAASLKLDPDSRDQLSGRAS